MRTSKQLFQNKMKKPINLDSLDTKEVIEKAGFVEFLDAGFPYFSPIGQKIRANLERLLSVNCEDNGFTRIQLPLIHRKELVERSGKYNDFKGEFVDIFGNYVLASTTEEYFLELARHGLNSYSQLPLKLFEISEAVRFIKRPQGILKLREFSGAVLISFEENEKGYGISLSCFKEIMQSTLEKLKVPFKIDKKKEGIEYFYDSSKRDSVEALSLAMGYRYNPSTREKVNFKSKENRLSSVILGTFGIGIERLFYATCDSCRDSRGFNFPESISPYNKAIIIMDPKENEQIRMGEDIYFRMKKIANIYLEDRCGITFKEKLDYADFLGVREKIIIGRREVKEGKSTIKMRPLDE